MSETNSVPFATSKKQLQDPIRKATAYSWVIPRAPSRYATGMEATRSARLMSAATMTCRRCRRRSTQTPATRARTRFGASPAAVR
jgi:hypothetical protein